jgi:hypothetical protein
MLTDGDKGRGAEVTTVTRDQFRILHHHEYDWDGPLLAVRYDVEGTDRRLIVSQLMPSDMEEGDEAVLNALLNMCDLEAQWSAEHPDQVEGWT